MAYSIDTFKDLFDYFEQFVTFSDQEKAAFATLLTPKTFAKGETVTAIGTVENYLSFLSTGIVRSYSLKGDDDITLSIDLPSCFISAYSSFTSREPSRVGLEALSDVTVYQMKYEHLQSLYDSSKEGERMGRFSAEQMSAYHENRLIDLLTKPATERYKELLENEPQLILTISQKYIAEYLGIKPESLSRLKKQMMNQP